MGTLRQLYIRRMVDYLAKEGNKIIAKAVRTKQVGIDTQNQNDAYGWVVWHNGRIMRKGYWTRSPQANVPHRGWEQVGISDGYGRDWLLDFINGYDKVPASGFALMVVNAAFYTVIHEKKYKYRVISQVFGDLAILGSKFKTANMQAIY